MSSRNSSETGIWGENQAEEFLKAKGYKILGQRVRIGDRDELDLVARDGKILVFVEVKTRGSQDFGRPLLLWITINGMSCQGRLSGI